MEGRTTAQEHKKGSVGTGRRSGQLGLFKWPFGYLLYDLFGEKRVGGPEQVLMASSCLNFQGE